MVSMDPQINRRKRCLQRSRAPKRLEMKHDNPTLWRFKVIWDLSKSEIGGTLNTQFFFIPPSLFDMNEKETASAYPGFSAHWPPTFPNGSVASSGSSTTSSRICSSWSPGPTATTFWRGSWRNEPTNPFWKWYKIKKPREWISIGILLVISWDSLSVGYWNRDVDAAHVKPTISKLSLLSFQDSPDFTTPFCLNHLPLKSPIPLEAPVSIHLHRKHVSMSRARDFHRGISESQCSEQVLSSQDFTSLNQTHLQLLTKPYYRTILSTKHTLRTINILNPKIE